MGGKLFRMAESFDGNWQEDGWQFSSGRSHFMADVGADVSGAAYNIHELTPAQRNAFDRDGEITIDDGDGGIVYLSK